MIRVLSCLMVAALVLAASSANADESEATAQYLYEQAQAAMSAGKHAEACPMLEKSLAIEEAMGARFLLAECYEKVGMLASAWSNYVRVADQANKEGQSDRESYSRDRAKALRARMPTVRLVVDPATRALDITVIHNGEPVSAALIDAPIPLDPGPHEFEIRAAGHESFKGAVTVVGENSTQTLNVPALTPLSAGVVPDVEAGDAPPPPPDQPDVIDDDGVNGMLIAGLVLGGVGLVGMGVSVAIAASAKSSYDDAIDTHCVDLRCNPAGVTATEDARGTGTLGTVVFGAGAGLAAVGVVLAIIGLTADGDGGDVALRVAPSLTAPGGVVQLEGAF